MKKRFFNMIEVMLALAVSAIGITAIMGIIPLGLKANRDAMADTFAADIANSYFAILSLDAATSFTDFVNDLRFKKAESKTNLVNMLKMSQLMFQLEQLSSKKKDINS